MLTEKTLFLDLFSWFTLKYIILRLEVVHTTISGDEKSIFENESGLGDGARYIYPPYPTKVEIKREEN